MHSLTTCAAMVTLDESDLCPETERTPVSTIPASRMPAKPFSIEGTTVWARTWEAASSLYFG